MPKPGSPSRAQNGHQQRSGAEALVLLHPHAHFPKLQRRPHGKDGGDGDDGAIHQLPKGPNKELVTSQPRAELDQPGRDYIGDVGQTTGTDHVDRVTERQPAAPEVLYHAWGQLLLHLDVEGVQTILGTIVASSAGTGRPAPESWRAVSAAHSSHGPGPDPGRKPKAAWRWNGKVSGGTRLLQRDLDKAVADGQDIPEN